MPDEEDLICADCGKSQGKKGSITQWMGLGDQCRCHLQADTSSFKKSDKKCRRCLKLKATAGQSMTGWLFKRDFCNCKDNEQSHVAPVKVIMSPRLAAGALPARSNKFALGIIAAACCASVVLCAAIIPIVSDALYETKISKGEDRVITVYDRSDKVHRFRFDAEAMGVIVDRNCTTLILSNAEISDEELGSIGKINELEHIHLKRCSGFTPIGLMELVQSSHLVSLNLERCSLNQELMDALASSRLERLDLSNSNAGDFNWERLTRISTLKDLVVFGVHESSQNKKYLEAQGFEGSDGHYRRVWQRRKTL